MFQGTIVVFMRPLDHLQMTKLWFVGHFHPILMTILDLDLDGVIDDLGCNFKVVGMIGYVGFESSASPICN